jgi:ribosomal protein S18 acetylase RimI-like enzyme
VSPSTKIGLVPVELRAATTADEPFLWAMLFEASHAAEDGLTGPDDLRAIPELARYVAGWGRPGDLGVVATEAELRGVRPAGAAEPNPTGTDDNGGVWLAGAAWVRLLTRAGGDAAYGWVDDATPELAIAVDPTRRGTGLGAAMLDRLLADARAAGFPGVSLSVRPGNPARRLYERVGFRTVDGSETTNRSGSTSLTMVLRWA